MHGILPPRPLDYDEADSLRRCEFVEELVVIATDSHTVTGLVATINGVRSLFRYDEVQGWREQEAPPELGGSVADALPAKH